MIVIEYGASGRAKSAAWMYGLVPAMMVFSDVSDHVCTRRGNLRTSLDERAEVVLQLAYPWAGSRRDCRDRIV
jgi:hypothetical protein